jgi:hypothetical protein
VTLQRAVEHDDRRFGEGLFLAVFDMSRMMVPNSPKMVDSWMARSQSFL